MPLLPLLLLLTKDGMERREMERERGREREMEIRISISDDVYQLL